MHTEVLHNLKHIWPAFSVLCSEGHNPISVNFSVSKNKATELNANIVPLCAVNLVKG